MKIVNIESVEEFEEKVINVYDRVLVDFYSDTCMPCKMMSTVLDSLVEEKPYVVVKVNVDEMMPLAEKYGIMSIPTLILFENGSISKKEIGLISKREIINMME